MPKEALLHRTAQVLRQDRLEIYRDFADDYQNYCFFVSMYEIAFQIHQEALPPRLVEAAFEWQDFPTRHNDGSIEVSEVIPLMVTMANNFGLKISSAIGFEAVLDLFAAIKPTKLPRLLMHVESRTSLPRSEARQQQFAQNNWHNAFIVTFWNEVVAQPDNSVASFPWQKLASPIIRPEPPYLIMMWKELVDSQSAR